MRHQTKYILEKITLATLIQPRWGLKNDTLGLIPINTFFDAFFRNAVNLFQHGYLWNTFTSIHFCAPVFGKGQGLFPAKCSILHVIDFNGPTSKTQVLRSYHDFAMCFFFTVYSWFASGCLGLQGAFSNLEAPLFVKNKGFVINRLLFFYVSLLFW